MEELIQRLYVFTYGGPIFVISINGDKMRIYTNLGDKNILEGMAIVANLVRRYAKDKIFVRTPYVGFFGDHYILVARVSRERFLPSALGLLRKIVQKLDSLGDLPTDYLIRVVLENIPNRNKYRIEII
ncbi:MAG: hypothetical protein ACTSX9_06640 [Candidatus Njordarchaeales archaeon]